MNDYQRPKSIFDEDEYRPQSDYISNLREGIQVKQPQSQEGVLLDATKNATLTGAATGNPYIAGATLALSAYQGARDAELQRQQSERELQRQRIEAMRNSVRNLFG